MNKLLTFELEKGLESLEIHCNKETLSDLINILEKIKEERINTNTKLLTTVLLTDAWGGDTLTSEKQGDDNMLINKVKIIIW